MYEGIIDNRENSQVSSANSEENSLWDESSVKVDRSQKQTILYIQVSIYFASTEIRIF